VRGVQAVTISAETGRGLDRLMEAVVRTHEIWNRRVSTGRLNRWLEGVIAQHPPPAVAGRRLKIKYMTQVKTRPPGFVVSCSRPEAVPDSYVRYLVNGLRDAFDLPGVPIRVALRTSENPYAGRARR
jgi:GTPase